VRISDFLEATRRDEWEGGIYSAAAVRFVDDLAE